MDPAEEASRCYVDQAMAELGVEEVAGRSFMLANLAATLALRDALVDAQPMVSRLVEFAGRSGMASGFDVAVAAIEGWAAGFFGGDTRGKLEALVRDLRRQKDELLSDSDARPKDGDGT